MNKPIIVQKYGGSSLATPQAIEQVAVLIAQKRQEGFNLCVVVSAMGKTTDQLVKLAKEISDNPPRRELDMLLTCGERTSMALLAMALYELGIPSISLTGSQSGIITDDVHSQATIVEVRPERIVKAFELHQVVIVAGFQGVSHQREITTLGRGGSDTTAVALAAALKAAACEIYSDVKGVYTADPKHVKKAFCISEMDAEEMLELAYSGAKVLNAQALQIAKLSGIPIMTGQTHQPGFGTLIHPRVVERRKYAISIAYQAQVIQLRSLTPLSLEGFALNPAWVLQWMGQTYYWIYPENAHQLEDFLAQHPEVEKKESLGMVSLVGKGLSSISNLDVRVGQVLLQHQMACEALLASPLRLSILLKPQDVLPCVSILHEAFVEIQVDQGAYHDVFTAL